MAEELDSLECVYIGEEGSFSDLALDSFMFAHPIFDYTRVRKTGGKSLKHLFEDVSDGTYDIGCVPLENSCSGVIDGVFELLGQTNVEIIGETSYHTNVCLCARPGATREKLKIVYSHSRILASCREYLDKLEVLTGGMLTRGLQNTTTSAAKYVASQEGLELACICSTKCAEQQGLIILDGNIADDANACTRFIFISSTPFDLTEYGMCKLRTLVCLTLENQPGALFKLFSVFAFREINIVALYNRPLVEHGRKQWNYKTFMTFQPDSPEQVEEVMEELKKWTVKVKLMGTYPEHLSNTKIKAQKFAHLSM